ncbi:hypothetical protein BC943DRAFT_313346 [Umbelopsis sp. AD052]|nr:hypothetical protein BC943DRAFT_313346 [Umbelopsis sp. AD052]
MGCCISMPHLLGKPLVYEVKIDGSGVAYRVPNGTGTHLIHINGDEEMFIEEKIKPHTTAYLDMGSDIAPPSYPGSLIEMPCPAAKS